MKQLIRLMRSSCGSMTVIMLGMLIPLLLIMILVTELGIAQVNYEEIEAILQRAANSAVEANMIDAYRADHLLVLDTVQAARDFQLFVESDLPTVYAVTISDLAISRTPPSLVAQCKVRIPTVFGQYVSEYTMDFLVRATNYSLIGSG